MILGYFYVNPDPIFFIIPGIGWPVAWYGVLFAFGVLMTYLGAKRFCKIFFLQHHKFYESDITSFERLIMSLKQSKDHYLVSAFLSNLPDATQKFIQKWNCHIRIPPEFKQSIIEDLNQFLNSETEFQKISQLKFFNQAKDLSPKQKASLNKRLKLEEILSKAFVSLSEKSDLIIEKVMFHITWAVTLGARLGHILFYEQLDTYLHEPLRFFKVWEGGLASHGAIVFGIIALALVMKRYKKTCQPLKTIEMFDILFLTSFMAFFWIRIGNFLNQEILGSQTNVSWAVVFGNPIDGAMGVARHPVQLYEAISYLVIWIFFSRVRKKGLFIIPGFMTFMLTTFGFCVRFFLEFLKVEQSTYSFSHLTMGQVLTLPGILLGTIGIYQLYKKSKIQQPSEMTN